MAKATSDVGKSGLNITWGGVDDDFLIQWRGPQKVKRIAEMLDNSPIIGALRLAIELPILDVDWKPTSEAGENDPRLQIINDSIANLQQSFSTHLSEALLSPFYGWHLFAMNYERIGGRLLWKEFKALGHDTIQEWQERERGRYAVQQYKWIYSDIIEPDRLLHYRFRSNRNSPEGKSILRPAWIPYYYVKGLTATEAIAYERNGAGYPVVVAPEGADMADGGTDSEAAEILVRNVRLDQQSGVVVPFGWDFHFESPGQLQDFDKPITRHESRMLMSALSQFLMVGMNNIGARATVEGGVDFFTLALNSMADNLADTVTKQAIAELLRLNGYSADDIKMGHSPVGDIDLNQVINVLRGGFTTWSDQDEDWLRQLLRMPERDQTTERPSRNPQPPQLQNKQPIPEEEYTYYAAVAGKKKANTPNRNTNQQIADYYDEMARLAEQARLGNIERQDFEERMRDITSAAILLAFLLAGGNPQNRVGQQRLAEMQRKAAESIPRLADDIYAGRYGETETQTADVGRD